MFDGKAFGAEIVDMVRGYVDQQTGPLLLKIASLEARLANLPEPAAGKDADPMLIEEMVQREVAKIPPARDGVDVDMAEVARLISAEVSKIPAPQDGRSITVDDAAPLIAAEVQKAVAAIPAAKDGVGLAGAILDRSGSLILTLTDGTTRDLGLVVGPAGADGKDGERGADGINGQDGKDGEPGEDGRDGAPGEPGADGREWTPRELYDPDAEYRWGHVVALNGAGFVARSDDPGPCPGEGWMMLSRQGKPGKPGDPGEPGKKGDPGPRTRLVGGKVDPERLELVLVQDDGEAVSIDLLPIAEVIRGAA